MIKISVFVFSLFLFVSCNKNIESIDKTLSNVTLFETKSKMVVIPEGSFIPFFSQDSIQGVHVKSFLMDETLVTNQEYLNFVKANPQWSRSKIIKLYADDNYLKNWKSDFELPEGISSNAPVTNVSWYAAKAFAQSLGKRMLTVDEWEFVGLANENMANASNNPDFATNILATYKTGARYEIPVKSGKPNFYGVYDMYESVWEWTSDFNSVMMTGESRNNNIKNESLFCAGASLTATDLKNYAAFIRFAMRGSVRANYCISNLGFRCAKDIN